MHTIFLLKIFEVIASTERHTYQVLTKRPERMYEFVKKVENACFYDWQTSFPNVWLGVTAENQQAADERIPWLLKTPAAVRFVSVEPMLEGMIIDGYIDKDPRYPTLDWVICGGETGHGARPMSYLWALDLGCQCERAGIPFFFKKWGDAYNGHKDPVIAGIREWPEAEA